MRYPGDGRSSSRLVAAAGACALVLGGLPGADVVVAGTGDGTRAQADLLLAETRGSERRGERRGDRDDRQEDRDECRDEGGALGKDKRDCKQEQRRDGPDADAAPAPNG